MSLVAGDQGEEAGQPLQRTTCQTRSAVDWKLLEAATSRRKSGDTGSGATFTESQASHQWCWQGNWLGMTPLRKQNGLWQIR
jgi:hypothetical protein